MRCAPCVFRLFAHLAFGDGPPAFDQVVHYVPGNHDHHEWEITGRTST